MGNGHWLNGKLPSLPPQAASAPPSFGPFAIFPTLLGQGWSRKVTPQFATQELERASGKSARRMHMRWPLYELELTYDFLRGDAIKQELQKIMGFFEAMQGQTQAVLASAARAFRFAEPTRRRGRRRDDGLSPAAHDGAFTEPLAGVESFGRARQRVAAGRWRLDAL